MSFQYIYDENGKPVGVFVPVNEWEKLTDELRKTKAAIGKSSSKADVLKSIGKGLKQVQQIEKGKKKSILLKQLLDAL